MRKGTTKKSENRKLRKYLTVKKNTIYILYCNNNKSYFMFYFQTAQLSKIYWLSACGTRTDGASHFTELQNVAKTFLRLPELY